MGDGHDHRPGPPRRRGAFPSIGLWHCAKLRTPPIMPAAFLRQYLEGKQHPPANIDEFVAEAEVMPLAAEKASKIWCHGSTQFTIAMKVVIAMPESASRRGSQLAL